MIKRLLERLKVLSKYDNKNEFFKKEKIELTNNYITYNKFSNAFDDKYKNFDDILSVKIKMGDLLDELKIIYNSDIDSIRLEVSYFFDDSKNDTTNNDDMNFLNNKLEVNFFNSKYIKYTGYNILTSLDDIQTDSKTLIEHCTDTRLPLDYNIKCFVIDINIQNVICVFDLDNVFNSYIKKEDNKILEQAVYSCIEKGKVIEITKKKTKSKIKTKSYH